MLAKQHCQFRRFRRFRHLRTSNHKQRVRSKFMVDCFVLGNRRIVPHCRCSKFLIFHQFFARCCQKLIQQFCIFGWTERVCRIFQ